MPHLIDTHAYLWYALGDSRISKTAREIIEDSNEICLVSTASIWELSIKSSLDRIELMPSFADVIPAVLDANAFEILGVTLDHTVEVSRLIYPENGHRDPFDRLMVAQCIVEDLPFVSVDSGLDEYPIRRVW